MQEKMNFFYWRPVKKRNCCTYPEKAQAIGVFFQERTGYFFFFMAERIMRRTSLLSFCGMM